MKSICFIVNKYPNRVDPSGLVFVQQLVWAISELGIKCTVICPLAINLNIKYSSIPNYVREITEEGRYVDVYFPKFFGLGQSHYILGKSPAPITTNLFTKSVLSVIKKNDLQLDMVYGHFITPAGIAAARIGRVLNIPAFMAYGESTTWSIDQFGTQKVKHELTSLSGVIAVSSRNRELLLTSDVVDLNKIGVFPNGYRRERFYKRSKIEARNKFGWPQNAFIVGMVGSFDNRKGILRLEEAVNKLDNVYFVCAGKGKLNPTSPKCLYASPVNNEELPDFYSALDVFVLPTLNEGCCNAIIEAMACGCPIISSDKSFNYDICDKTNSILIDPGNVDAICKAITYLKEHLDIMESLGKGSLNKANSLTLEERAKKILNFMQVINGKIK